MSIYLCFYSAAVSDLVRNPVDQLTRFDEHFIPFFSGQNVCKLIKEGLIILRHEKACFLLICENKATVRSPL